LTSELGKQLQYPANDIEINAGHGDSDLHYPRRVQEHQQRNGSETAPQEEDHEIERPEQNHAHGMQEMDRREGEHRRDKDDGEGDIFVGLDDEEREHNHVPDYRKALEEVLARLDACVGVVDRAGNDDDRSRKKGKPWPHEAALIKGEGGNENVGDVVD